MLLSEFLVQANPTLTSLMLFEGDEEFRPLIDCMLEFLKPELSNFSINKFKVDKNLDFTGLKGIISCQDFFTNNYYVELEGANFNLEQQDKLLELFSQVESGNFLIIITKKLSYSEQKAKWVETISRLGIKVTVTYQDLSYFIKFYFLKSDLSITPNAIKCLIERSQDNMAELLQEMQRLSLYYSKGYTIDVAEITFQSHSKYTIFDLSYAYLCGNLDKSMQILEYLLTESEAVLILWIINEDLSKLLKIKSSLKQQKSFSQVAYDLKIRGQTVSAFEAANKRLTYKNVITQLELLANLDLVIKGVIKGDIKTLFAQLILNICNLV